MKEFVDQVKKSAKGTISPLPPPKQINEVSYSAQNLRSPFVLSGGSYVNSPGTITSSSGDVVKQLPRPDLKRPREYLEQFPLSSFVMVGTLSKADASWGLVKDGSGMIHAVKIGDYLGLNSGEIVAITPDQIRLNETVPNGSGGWMKSRAVLNLIQAPPTPDASAGTNVAPGAQAPAAPTSGTQTTPATSGKYFSGKPQGGG